MKIADYPAPVLDNRKGAIIEVLGCGLCGSDIVKIQKDLVPVGTVLGHEVIGFIKELNTEIETSLQVGDKIAVAHHVPCYECKYCKQRSYSMCKTFKNTNLDPGGFSEYLYLSELHLKYNTIKIPDRVNELQASLMEPLGCILRALDRANISQDQSILVVGLGFIGLLFVQALKAKGYKILGCDLIEERLELATQMGADFVFKSDNIDESVLKVNKNINFPGVDVVVLASGANKSVELATKIVRDGGKIVIFASIPDENTGYLNNDIYYKELEVIGAYSSSPEFLVSAMELISCGKIKMDDYCETMFIEDINLAVEKTLKHQTLKVYLKV